MTADEIPDYQTLLQKLKGKAVRRRFPTRIGRRSSALSFAYIEPRHRFGLLTDDLMAKIVDARGRFYEGLPEAICKGAIEPYDPERYTAAASVMDNVLFGRIGHNHPDGPERIRSHRLRAFWMSSASTTTCSISASTSMSASAAGA